MTTPVDDILLFGLGAVGAVYAYVLNEAPNTRVTVCARSNYVTVNESGLDFQSEKFGNSKNYKFHKGTFQKILVRRI